MTTEAKPLTNQTLNLFLTPTLILLLNSMQY